MDVLQEALGQQVRLGDSEKSPQSLHDLVLLLWRREVLVVQLSQNPLRL